MLSDFKVFGNFYNDASWSSLTTENGPGSRHSHSSVFYKECIYIFGGKINIIENSNDLFCYSIENKKWKKIIPKNVD